MEKPTWLSTQLFKFRLNRLLKKLNRPDINGYEELVLMCDIINLMYGYIDCDDKELDTTLYAETNSSSLLVSMRSMISYQSSSI